MRCLRFVVAVACLVGCRSRTVAPPPSAPPTSAPMVLVTSGADLVLTGTQPFTRARAPFDPKLETIDYAGVAPQLFAFRRKNVPCLAPDDAAVLVQSGDSWRTHLLRERTSAPHAFVAWDGNALLIDSQLQACGWATSSPVERLVQPAGTVFTQVTPSGTLTHPTLGLDDTFMAWGGSSAEQTLALVGTYGVRAADSGASPAGSHDIVVMRRHGAGPFKATLIVKAEGPASQSLRTRVREFGAAALLWPPPVRDDGSPVAGAPAEGGDELSWNGHAASIVRITDEATTAFKFRSYAEQDCAARDAALAGDNVYAIVACPNDAVHVVRAAPHGDPERVELPATPTLGRCTPVDLLGLAPDELWVLASCSSGQQAVFHRGHPG